MPQPDTEKFRLRSFVERLVQQGHCVVHDAPIDLVDVAAALDGNPKAVWFRNVGPERTELVGNVMGARERLALALDTDSPGFARVLRERLAHPFEPIEVPSAAAPVHEVVLTGEDADLTRLPVHLQHGRDGAKGISRSADLKGRYCCRVDCFEPSPSTTTKRLRDLASNWARVAGLSTVIISRILCQRWICCWWALRYPL